jgi:hypothetical protein
MSLNARTGIDVAYWWMKIGFRAAVAISLAVFIARAYGQNSVAPIKTTLCEVVKEPERFNGKMIQIRAKIMSRFEWGGIIDESCSANLLVDDLDNAFYQRKGEFVFINSQDDLKRPNLLKWRPIETPHRVQMKEDDSYRTLERYVSQKFTWKDGSKCFSCPLYDTIATIIGRFEHLETQMVAVRADSQTKPTTYMAGFGHLNASRSRLVMQSVSNVVANPIDPSVYKQRK